MGVITTGGTVLKGLGIRKVGSHCCREFFGSLKSPGRMSNLARDGCHCLDSDGGRQNVNQESGELTDC